MSYVSKNQMEENTGYCHDSNRVRSHQDGKLFDRFESPHSIGLNPSCLSNAEKPKNMYLKPVNEKQECEYHSKQRSNQMNGNGSHQDSLHRHHADGDYIRN